MKYHDIKTHNTPHNCVKWDIILSPFLKNSMNAEITILEINAPEPFTSSRDAARAV